MTRTHVTAVALFCGVAVAGTAAPAQAGNYTALYAFQGGSDGANPRANLITVGGTAVRVPRSAQCMPRSLATAIRCSASPASGCSGTGVTIVASPRASIPYRKPSPARIRSMIRASHPRCLTPKFARFLRNFIPKSRLNRCRPDLLGIALPNTLSGRRQKLIPRHPQLAAIASA